MLLSHKKYQEIQSSFQKIVQDETTLHHLLNVIREVIGYSTDGTVYNQRAYEQRKERIAQGDTSYADYQKKYYQAHKDAIRKRKAEKYQQQSVSKEA